MTRSQVIQKLSAEGFAITVGRVRQALINGYVRPLPKKTARGAFDYRAPHLRAIRWYLTHIRPGPRPGNFQEIQISGSADRMHRPSHREQLQEERALRLRSRKEADAAIEWLERIALELS